MSTSGDSRKNAKGFLADKLLVLLIGDHNNALLVPAGDQLRSLGVGAAKGFAKARLGGLQLRVLGQVLRVP
jgi:hypothetical protein